MSNELTYILGAGASYQSIPLVKTFNKRFNEFNAQIIEIRNHYSGRDRIIFENAVRCIEMLHKDFLSHQSFDTYFKKLFHFGDKKQIDLGKKILNLYFTWEHSNLSQKHISGLSAEDFHKQALFDKRYDALIAGLLMPNPGVSDPVCQVNFITWNYDINLLHAIKNFFDPELTYREFLDKIQKEPFVWRIGEKINIVNINGHYYSSIFDACKNLTNIDVMSAIVSKLFEGYLEKDVGNRDAELIRFAWELGGDNLKSLGDSLRSIIAKSQDIVVIGYTFPIYNRLIDFMYLKQRTINSNSVTIQDPNADAIRQNLLDVYKIPDNSSERIRTVSNCDNFYIPSRVFTFPDNSPFDGFDLSWQ